MADFDVAGLGSLLLDDTHTASSLVNEDLSDYMEIDDLEIDDAVVGLDLSMDGSLSPSTISPLISDNTQYTREIPLNVAPDIESPEPLIKQVLSPTKLGARLAIAHQRLIMPPAPASGSLGLDYDGDYDYEFDMSSYKGNGSASATSQTLVGPDHHVSSTRVDTGLFLNGAEPELLGNLLSPMHFSGNHKVQSQFPESISSLQIHHHHYYPEMRRRRGSTTNEIPAPQRESALQRNSFDPSQSRLSSESEFSYASTTAANSTLLSPILPSPWEHQIHAAQPHAYVIWSYIQLSLNTSVAVYALYLGFCAVLAVRADISDEMLKLSGAAASLQDAYKRLYISNQCDDPVPMQQAQCDEWARRMHRYSGGGFRVQTLAHMVGIVVSRLVEPLTFKVFIVVASMLVLAFACNFSLGYIRAKSYYGASDIK